MSVGCQSDMLVGYGLADIARSDIHATTSGSTVMTQTMVFMFLVTLTLTFDLCYIFRYTY